jgi:hypothetical protein
VEVPLALPVIVTGIRTAAVQVVATATLAALVGGGGLGRFIVDGFAVRDEARLLGGAILVALLALATERLFTLLERRVTVPGGCGPRRRRASSPSHPDPAAPRHGDESLRVGKVCHRCRGRRTRLRPGTKEETHADCPQRCHRGGDARARGERVLVG